jgi:hypothetical protein
MVVASRFLAVKDPPIAVKMLTVIAGVLAG